MASSNTPKQLEKISADCPHCGFSQLESAYAKSTFCRKCGEHFSIEKLLLKEATSLKGPSFFDKLSKLVSREKIRTVSCFSCHAQQQVSTEAQSTSCSQCGSYIDLREFKIDGPFGRSIQTQGEVIITPKGDVASSRIACGSAFIEGKFKGALFCTGLVRVRMKGKFIGSVESEKLVIEKKSEVEFVRPVKVRSIEINGKTLAHVECDGRVTINKGGSLEGSIQARAITIEKGGTFSGELSISSPEPPPSEETVDPFDTPPDDHTTIQA
ncbi:MAG: polymer-forming cytoskeletal protein [Verrucomicrobiota bacterium]